LRRAIPVILALALGACTSEAVRHDDMTEIPTPPALVVATDGDLVVSASPGYEVAPLIRGLSFPSGICFDDEGHLCVLESGGLLGNNPSRTPPRILCYSAEGNLVRTVELARSHVVFPANGIVFSGGSFFISHRDEDHLGVVSRVDKDGSVHPIVSGLPSRGDHGTNQICFGPDGKLYVAQGTATNSGVVGVDNFTVFGWGLAHPDVHDVPATNVVLAGKKFLTSDPRGAVPGMKATTGAFEPFGTAGERGDAVKGDVKCNGSVLVCDRDGGHLEVFCWGIRNPFGLGFRPDKRLLATCQGIDLRGSRPVANDKDALLSLRKGAWYGWPDYTTDLKPLLDDKDHDPPEDMGLRAQPLIDWARTDVSAPDRSDLVMTFPARSAPCGFAWAPPSLGKLAGRLVVAEFGALGPVSETTLAATGNRVVTVDADGHIEDFLTNDEPGPASRNLAIGRGLEHPVDVKVGPDGALYVVDMGVITVGVDAKAGVSVTAREGTGFVWRIRSKEAAPHARE